MNVARHTKRLLAALLASTLTVVDVHAAVTDIFSQPLATTSTVVAKPNIMFILDNSGSMASAYMPDDMSDTGKYGYWSTQCNGLAFDPTYTYTPPVKADGSSYADASFTNALNDGFAYQGNGTLRFSTDSRSIGIGSKTFTLDSGSSTSYPIGNQVAVSYQQDGAVRMTGTVTAWDSTSKLLTLNITAVEGSGTYNSWYVSRMLTLDGSTYYTYTGSPKQPLMGWTYNSSSVITTTTFYQECMSNIGSTPGSNMFTLQTVSTASSSATMQQNYANWNAYYRTRRLLMRTAAGRAFQSLDNKFRVGFTTISDTSATQGSNRFIDIGDFDAAKKADFYKSLYTADGNSYTPLRGALSKVGRYFANKAPGQTSDPMQYSCQRNYAILSTDGYWNNNTESSTYGPLQVSTNTSVGQQDAGDAKPMHDGAIAITTTVTPYTTITRNSTPQTRTDTNNWRRYAYPVPSSTGSGSCSGSQYRIRVQQQNRTESIPVTLASVDDTTTVVTNTKVVNVATGTTISDTNATTSNSTVHISTSVISTGSSTFGSWNNSGGTTDYCRTAAQLTALGMSPGNTYYSTTGCGGSCTYTAVGANGTQTSSNTGSASASGGSTQLSVNGPTAGTSTSTDSYSGGASPTLADVAEYYYKTDLRTATLNNCTGNGGNDVCSNSTMLPLPPLDIVTTQHMVTFTIGLGVGGTLAYDPNYLTQASGTYVNLKNGTINWPDPMPSEGATRVDDLWHAAVNGRGRYFATNNANTLSNALTGALADATKATGSAAGAATNSLEPVVGESNNAYIATYTTLEWTGDIKAYPLDAMTGSIDTSTATWSAKTQLQALSAGSRNIKYMHPTTKALRAFNYTNLSADGYGGNFSNICSKSPAPLQCGTLGSAQVTLANTGDNLVTYLRGDSTYDAGVNSTNPLYRARTAKLGDIINASPVYVKKSPLQYLDTGYATFAAGTASRKAMLYSAANDGMLHAFDATTGNELWAFVPSYVMPNMYKLADTDYRDHHAFFVDGTPVVGDIYTGSAWKTILVGGLNSGGKGYYALDITDPDNPVALWEFTDTNMGLTYGNPVITKQKDGTWVVAVSSGYNNTNDGLGRIYLINAATGTLVTSMATTAGTSATPSGLGKINAWVDSGSDNTAKRFYGGDMLGNLWRFDFDDLVAPPGAEVTQLARFLVGGTTPQPITTKPQLTVITASSGTKVPVIVVATGRYLGTSDVTDTTQQSIYAIKDPLSGSGWGDVRSRVDLVSQSVTVSGITGTGTTNAVDWLTKIGWKLDLPQSKERVVTDFVLQFNVLTVASAIPGANECNPSGGASWLYGISAASGTAANGSTLSEYLGAFLVVGMTSIKTADGNMKIEIVGSDASVRTKQPPPPDMGPRSVRRSAWRELIN
jgi:type IV pilus assembly protein PilY1